MVWDESAKTVKIMRLKNLALYSNCKRMNGKEVKEERSKGGRREGKRWGGKEGGREGGREGWRKRGMNKCM